MMLTIDPQSSTPPFEQLRAQIIQQIGDGALAPGTKLPAVRRLAGDLGLAANTVARTYRELEQEGYVRTAGRNGTIVADSAVDVNAEAQSLAHEFALAMRGLGLGPDEAVAYVRRALAALSY